MCLMNRCRIDKKWKTDEVEVGRLGDEEREIWRNVKRERDKLRKERKEMN